MSWKLGLVVVVACFSSPFTPASAQSFTLQQVMSGTFNSELQASPNGSRVVWMANQEGSATSGSPTSPPETSPRAN